MPDRALFDALKRLHSLTEKVPSDEAIRIIDEEIADPRNADYVPHFTVHKASILCSSGRKPEAVQVLERCALEYDEVDSVHYFTGEALLELGRFAQAEPYLSRCIDIAESTGERWYKDSAYLLRAYCAAKTGKPDLARHDLIKQHLARQELGEIEGTDAMPWIEADPVVSTASIEHMLKA